MDTSILYVEDEPDYQVLVSKILQNIGVKTQVADTGDEGIQQLMRQRPSLLLLDVNLPDTDGYSLCDRIRKEEMWADLPIVMLTVRRRPNEWLEGFSSGADDYLSKPFNPTELIERVQLWMNGKPKRHLSSDRAENLLIEAALAGNRSAFEVLITQYKQPLLRCLWKEIGSEAPEVDDIVSMTFLRAFERLSQFRGESTFFTWLYSIAYNELQRHWRQKTPISIDELKEPDQALAHLSEGLILPAEADFKVPTNQLEQAMSRLPHHYRRALELYYIEGLPYESISRRLNVPEGTVMSRLHRGKAYLRKAFRRPGQPLTA